MARPTIGICAAVERATFGVWVDEPAALVPISYVRAVQASRGLALLLPPDGDAVRDPAEILDRMDGLLIGGGADLDPSTHGAAEAHPQTRNTNPERDRFEIALAREALDRDFPVLGVCRGMQLLNVAAGGTLEQHLPDRLGQDPHRPVPGSWADHPVRLQPGSLAARVAGAERLEVKSHHHQGIADLGDAIEVSGWSDDPADPDTIEAIEFPDRSFALGVLWHPEEDTGDRVIPAFVERLLASVEP